MGVSSKCQQITGPDGEIIYIGDRVGTICWIFIIIKVIFVITNIVSIFSQFNKHKRKRNMKGVIVSSVNIFIDMFFIFLTYKWCKLCRGLQVYFLVLFLSVCIRLFEMYVVFDGFEDYSDSLF